MAKRAIIYLLLAGILVAIGVLISRQIVTDDEVEFVPDKNADMLPEHPETLQKDNSQETSAADAGADAGSFTVKVLKVKGDVTTGDDEKGWTRVAPGTSLAVEDQIKTESSSEVTLGLGEKSTMEVSPNARLEIRELTDSVQRLGLLKGRASVDYAEDGDRVLKIENEDGSAVAKVKKGRFSILSSGRAVAVATETGKVDLSAAGRTVEVTPGNQSVIYADGAPSNPKAIPASLLLKVTDPGCIVQKELSYTVRGKTSPGSRVSINGKDGIVNIDGRFKIRVPLRVGKNKITVVTTDVTGRRKERVFPCVTVDPDKKIDKIDINWGASS